MPKAKNSPIDKKKTPTHLRKGLEVPFPASKVGLFCSFSQGFVGRDVFPEVGFVGDGEGFRC